MCENDSVGEKSDEKPAEITPSVSSGPTRVSKIFILTPEILQSLGLTGFTNARIASQNKDESKTVKINLPIVKEIQASTDKKEANNSVVTIGKLVKQSTSKSIAIKKPRRDSVSASARDSNDTEESSVLFVPSSVEVEKRLNGESPEKIATVTKINTVVKGSISSPAPKAKNVRRKSSTGNLQNDQTEEQKNSDVIATKNRLETSVPGVEAQAEESGASIPPKAKIIRRKSIARDLRINQTQETINEDVVTTNIQSEQTTPGGRSSRRVSKPKRFDDFVLTEKTPHGRSTNDVTPAKPQSRRSSLNSESPSSTTKSSRKEPAKGNLKEKPETIDFEVEDATIVPKKTVKKEIPKEKSPDDVVERPSFPKKRSTLPQSPTIVAKKILDEPHEQQNPKKPIISKNLEAKEQTFSKKRVGDSKQPSSSGTGDCSPIREDGFLVPKTPISAGKKKLHKSLEAPSLVGKPKEDRVLQEAETTPKIKAEIEAPKLLLDSPDKKIEANSTKLDIPRCRVETNENSGPPSTPEINEEISAVNFDSPGCSTEKGEAELPQRGSPSTPKKNKEISTVNSVSPESPDRKEEAIIDSFASPKSAEEDKEISVAYVASPKSPVEKEEVSIDPFNSPRSPDEKKQVGIIPLASPRSAEKNGENTVADVASPKSPDVKEEVIIVPLASPRSAEKNEENSVAAFPPPGPSDGESKEEFKTVPFALPKTPDENREVSDTQLNQPASPDIKEEGEEEDFASHFDSPQSPNKIEVPEHKTSDQPTSPVEVTEIDTDLFNFKIGVDAPNKLNSDATTEMPIQNEITEICDFDDYEITTETVEIIYEIADETTIETAPDKASESAPDKTPETAPDKARESASDKTRESAPDTTPETARDKTPETAPEKTRESAPDTTLETARDKPPETAPDKTPETAPDKALECAPDKAPEAARHKTPESPLKRYPRRGRSRKPSTLRESTPGLETETPAKTKSIVIVENPVENTSRRKKPVQRNEDVTDGKGLSDGSEDDSEQVEVTSRTRGRPSGAIRRGRGRGRGRGRKPMDTEYVPRVAPTSKDKSKTEEAANAETLQQPSGANAEKVETPMAGDLECGKCKERMFMKMWPKHNLTKHNEMGWLSGNPEPDWEKDVKHLRSILTAILKKKKKTRLTCETCGAEKRSANGFISHLQFCGKTDDERQSLMVTCPICSNVMMPASVEMHERTHRVEDKPAKEKKTEETDSPLSSSRGKRKAAERAATKIQEFTDLVKEDEPVKKRRRTKDELEELIAKPQSSTNPPNRWKGMWKSEIAKDGKASCRHDGCKFTAESLERICNHSAECSSAPQPKYMCKICLFTSATEETTLKHVEAHHSLTKSKEDADSDFQSSDNSDNSDTNSEASEPKLSAFKRDNRFETQSYNVKFLDKEVKVDSRWPFTYPPALRWSIEFERKHYRLKLFEDLLPNPMKLLDHEKSLDYLPELSRSMQINESEARSSTSARWTTMERFEATVAGETPMFFAGGPVWAIAWLPIPAPMYDQPVDQFVAVSTHSTMESVYAVGKPYVGKNVIQIWNLGALNHSKSAAPRAPVASYGVAHDKGTIWCMEWCPSGCYDDPSFSELEENLPERGNNRRMGLLATACSDGCVHVYSLPFPKELGSVNEPGDSRLPIYETKPILTLTVSTRMYDEGEQNWQCTKLNWCRELGHNLIIAGFSNGQVAIWDLASESPMFVTTRGETTFIDAFHHFYAHGHAVSAVQMIPYGDKRFFVTSSYDRMTKFWDLEDTSFPVTATKRGIAVDGACLTHWAAYITAYDDVMLHAHTYLLSLRQPGMKIFPLLPTNSPTYSVSATDYGNGVSHGTLAGEVIVIFPNHLWNSRDMEKLAYKKRWFASSIDVVDFEKEKVGSKRKKPANDYEYTPETYDECKERYGLVFRDRLSRTHLYSRKNKSKASLSEKLTAVNVEQYPFASANRVSWNPNAWSYLWLCVGYQNGLVRFLNFKSVALDKELRKLLPAHAKFMLNETRSFKSNSRSNGAEMDCS